MNDQRVKTDNEVIAEFMGIQVYQDHAEMQAVHGLHGWLLENNKVNQEKLKTFNERKILIQRQIDEMNAEWDKIEAVTINP